jgi:hypothetical protein
LPGVAGPWGVPVWVFYVNRGQGVISFGLKDKDHSITEFFPANNAYTFTPLLGFRTFLKIDNRINYEPFRVSTDYQTEEQMLVKSSSFEIRTADIKLGLKFHVKYFTLPNTPVGALARVLSIRNLSDCPKKLEILDGLPKIVPFGLSNILLKDLARTLEAWMRVCVSDNLAIFRLIVDPKDWSQTKYIDGANFNYSFYEESGKNISPYLIIDPTAIFGQDASFSLPINFYKTSFSVPVTQINCGKTPCAFSHFKWNLAANEEKTFYSLYGASFKMELIENFVKTVSGAFLDDKEQENEKIIEGIKEEASCISDSNELNQYAKCSYLDNVLRGGYPYKFNGGDFYYIFSRKHGDLERDYNKFKLLPCCFSEGEANYRDINQNRRIDLFFNPFIERRNIVYFLNFIKIDGYNPLVIKGEKLFFGQKEARGILQQFNVKEKKAFSLMVGGFYLGDFFRLLKEAGITVADKTKLAQALVKRAKRVPQASHQEGYWIDHWRYNLDLIENFLYFYPDKIQELFLNKEYCFWNDNFRVKERKRRYHFKDAKVYQWHSVEEVLTKRKNSAAGEAINYLGDRKGNIYKTTLLEKLLLLILNKAATLDPCGIGIEMEADKPGWCDSLNGLPALFGSSLCETFELIRSLRLVLRGLDLVKNKNISEISVCEEGFLFFDQLDNLLMQNLKTKNNDKDFIWWDKANAFKEKFRAETFCSLNGKIKKIKIAAIESFLNNLLQKLDSAMAKAKDKSTGLYFTYLTYEVNKYMVKNKFIIPLRFERKTLAHFLEGQVHALRIADAGSLYRAVKKSKLFDQVLKMYRLNESLEKESLEIGRSRIFVPGWLENESIWLHMEYKYLLEVLNKGLYEEFFRDFFNCGVCFFDAGRYGRNILENSSFIVSSAYPDKSLWGKGFVARLSGATVELLHILSLMYLGKNPFSTDAKGKLQIKFSPILKGSLFTKTDQKTVFKGRNIDLEKNSFAFALFSSVLVVYHNPKRKDTFTGDCRIKKIKLAVKGETQTLDTDTIPAPLSEAVRRTEVEQIDVYLE